MLSCVCDIRTYFFLCDFVLDKICIDQELKVVCCLLRITGPYHFKDTRRLRFRVLQLPFVARTVALTNPLVIAIDPAYQGIPEDLPTMPAAMPNMSGLFQRERECSSRFKSSSASLSVCSLCLRANSSPAMRSSSACRACSRTSLAFSASVMAAGGGSTVSIPDAPAGCELKRDEQRGGGIGGASTATSSFSGAVHSSYRRSQPSALAPRS